MRSKIFIAVLATAIVMSSCDWLTAQKQTSGTFSIEGKWIIDSIKPGSDSTQKEGSFPLAFPGDPSTDSADITYAFAKDTLIAKRAGRLADTLLYRIHNNQISFKSKSDSTEQLLHYLPLSDSLISITHTDSSTVFLRKTK